MEVAELAVSVSVSVGPAEADWEREDGEVEDPGAAVSARLHIARKKLYVPEVEEDVSLGLTR